MNRARAAELLPIIQAFAEGREIQYRMHGFTEWSIVLDAEWNNRGDYRIKPLEFPLLPEGLEWHNADELTPDLVGADKRLLTKQELDGSFSSDSNEFKVSWWINGKWVTTSKVVFANASFNTYAVPISTPFPEPAKKKVMVPLEAHDVSPGSLIKLSETDDWYADEDDEWSAVGAVSREHGICIFHFDNSCCDAISWDALRSHRISRDGGRTWQPCEKEAP